jgi:dienelactone hydrolase
VPVDYRGDEPFALLVYLGGGPGIAMDTANATEPTISKTKYLVVYPHAGGRMWWDAEPAKMVDALLRELSALLNIKPGAIYIAGFSNGGTGAVSYASKWPKRFAAVVSLMGAAACVDAAGPLRYEAFTGMPVLVVHGDKDKIIPHDCSEQLYSQLRKHKADVTFRTLNGRGHDITVGNDEGLTLSFLDSIMRASDAHSPVGSSATARFGL